MKLRFGSLLAVTVIVAGSSAIGYTTQKGDALRRLVLQVSGLVDNYADQLTPQEEQSVSVRLEEVRKLIDDGHKSNPPPFEPPGQQSFYCSSACTDSRGQADLRYSRGGRGETKAEAQQNADDNLNNAFRCSRGITTVDCNEEKMGFEDSNSCLASCVYSNNRPDFRFAEASTGRSSAEAKQSARELTQTSYNCNYAVKDVQCSTDARPTLCAAACTYPNGLADTRYSRRANGANETDAMNQAIKSVKTFFTCTYGITVFNCQER